MYWFRRSRDWVLSHLAFWANIKLHHTLCQRHERLTKERWYVWSGPHILFLRFYLRYNIAHVTYPQHKYYIQLIDRMIPSISMKNLLSFHYPVPFLLKGMICETCIKDKSCAKICIHKRRQSSNWIHNWDLCSITIIRTISGYITHSRQTRKPEPPHAVATGQDHNPQWMNYTKKASRKPRKPVAGVLKCRLLIAAALEVFSGSWEAVGVIVIVLVLVLVLVLLLLVSALLMLNSE